MVSPAVTETAFKRFYYVVKQQNIRVARLGYLYLVRIIVFTLAVNGLISAFQRLNVASGMCYIFVYNDEPP